MNSKIFISTLVIVFVIISCGNTKSLSKQEKVSINNRWELIEYLGLPIDTNVFRRSIPTFTINSDKGSFGGNNGCNSVSGKLSTDGSKIKMNIFIGTKMVCVGIPENEFERKISEVNNYFIKDNQLHLKKDKETLFVFKLVRP